MQDEPNAQNKQPLFDEPFFTPDELAADFGVHRTTIVRTFIDEPGVIRYGRPGSRKKRQYFTLRIPKSVAERVFARMTVQGSKAQAR
jgi:hypothetical protein